MSSRWLIPIIRKVEGWQTDCVSVEGKSREEAAEIVRKSLGAEDTQVWLVDNKPLDTTLDWTDIWSVDDAALRKMLEMDHEGE